MRRDTVAGFLLGAFVTGALGVLWYRHWSAIPELRVALQDSRPVNLRLDLPEHDHWTWASEEEVERAFNLLEDRRLSEYRRDDLRMDEALKSPRLRPVDRDQWCGNALVHRAHERCGGTVVVDPDDRPQCRWPEVHGSHVWRDVELEGHKAAKPRYCRGRTEGE